MKFIGDPDELYKEILNIVRSSKIYLYIVSPYTGFEKDNSSITAFKNSFIDAFNRNVNITIITRGRDPQAPMNNIYKIKDFLGYPGHIHLVPYLHSKIYCNKSLALITSLNLSISSLFNQNEESGILLDCNNNLESNEYKKVKSDLNLRVYELIEKLQDLSDRDKSKRVVIQIDDEEEEVSRITTNIVGKIILE